MSQGRPDRLALRQRVRMIDSGVSGTIDMLRHTPTRESAHITWDDDSTQWFTINEALFYTIHATLQTGATQ